MLGADLLSYQGGSHRTDVGPAPLEQPRSCDTGLVVPLVETVPNLLEHCHPLEDALDGLRDTCRVPPELCPG